MYALLALINLSYHNPAAQDEIGAQGGVETVLRVLTTRCVCYAFFLWCGFSHWLHTTPHPPSSPQRHANTSSGQVCGLLLGQLGEEPPHQCAGLRQGQWRSGVGVAVE